MSKDKISDYSTTANSNTDIGGINVDEGCAPSGINDAIRTLMAQLKTWQSGGQDVYIHPAGSASAPSITANGDTNTGIFFPAADTVGITTGGTERARVDSSGNIGIGATPSVSGVEISRATGVSPTPVELRLATITNDSGWSTSNPWARLSFYSSDASVGGAKIHASIQTVAQSSAGGNSNLDFFVTDTANGTLYRTMSFQGAGTNTTQTLFYSGSGSQAMTLDASGRLGIGTTSPQTKLHVSNGSTENIEISPTYIQSFNRGGSPGYADLNLYASNFIFNNGNLLVGTTSAGAMITAKTQTASGSALATLGTSGDTSFQSILVTKFDNNSTTSQNFIQFQINNGGANCGRITANGANTAAFGSTSDQRVKENIVDLPSQLANIMSLRPVEYDYIESYGGGHQIGFIAQEMKQVYPDVISEDDSEEKILSITGWSKTEARLVKAIQEQQAIITALTARIEALEQA